MKKTLLFIFASVALLGVFAFAEDATTGTTDTTVTSTLSTDAIACVKTAIETRESAIKSAMEAYYASWGTAFTARTTAITDALFQPTKQAIKKGVDVAIKKYRTAIDSAKKSKKGLIQTAWNAYRTSMKACKGDVAKVLKDQNGKSDLTD